MLKITAIIIIALIVLVMIIAATKPDSFSVQRSIIIKSAPDRIFALISDFHHWPSWSPWEKMDPAMKRNHSGVAYGTGALYAWDGNSKIGEGSMEIVESLPPAKVVIKLDFNRPFEGHNIAEFFIVDRGRGDNRYLADAWTV